MELTIKKKTLRIFAIIIVILLALFVLRTVMADEVAKKGDTVSVDYWLEVDGEQIDTSEGRGEFSFTLGAGEVIPGFDKTVTGMKVGEEKEVDLSGSDAYTAGPLAGKVLHFRVILRDIE